MSMNLEAVKMLICEDIINERRLPAEHYVPLLPAEEAEIRSFLLDAWEMEDRAAKMPLLEDPSPEAREVCRLALARIFLEGLITNSDYREDQKRDMLAVVRTCGGPGAVSKWRRRRGEIEQEREVMEKGE